MIFVLSILIPLILSYLLGSISGSMFLGKFKKVDIRNLGSGNAGGTNALRTMGKKFALGVILIDIIKGYFAVEFISILYLFPASINSSITSLTPSICGLGVVIGHVYPLYYNFKGGKGAGTMVGVLLSIYPFSLIFCLAFWIVSLILTGYVGFSTIIAGISLPICVTFFYNTGILTPFGIFTIFISIFILYTHRANINRMILGEENRFKNVMIFKRK